MFQVKVRDENFKGIASASLVEDARKRPYRLDSSSRWRKAIQAYEGLKLKRKWSSLSMRYNDKPIQMKYTDKPPSASI
jgi:hypothetical protein